MGLDIANIHPACILVCQNLAILYTISRQIATISTNIENAERI